jgi:hypothetical protein
MNSALEFHDSDVEAISGSGDCLRVVFSGAYVHRSARRPGIDAGTGYMQPAELVFSLASWSAPSSGCSGAISDGALVVNGTSMSLVPLPFSASGQISVDFTFASGATFSASAASVSCTSTGESRFIESYAADQFGSQPDVER